jgi:hypothetical protein
MPLTPEVSVTINIGDFFQIVGSILAAAISAIALIRSSNSNISDKISRAQWAFEMYISCLGVCLVGNYEDFKKYKAFYYIFYAYADEEIKERLLEVDALVETNEKSIAKKKLLALIERYYEKYDLGKYGLKEKINSNEIKKIIT